MRGFLLACLLVAPVAPGQMLVPEPADALVNDFAGLLDSRDVRAIEAVTSPLAAAGTPIVVVTVEDLATYRASAATMGEFARKLYDAWRIGAPGNRGALILMARADRRVWVRVGADYARFDPEVTQSIVDSAIVPRFRDNDIAGGLVAGVTAIRDRIIRVPGSAQPFGGTPARSQPTEWGLPQQPAQGSPFPSTGGGGGFKLPGGNWLCMIVGVFIVMMIVKGIRSRTRGLFGGGGGAFPGGGPSGGGFPGGGFPGGGQGSSFPGGGFPGGGMPGGGSWGRGGPMDYGQPRSGGGLGGLLGGVLGSVLMGKVLRGGGSGGGPFGLGNAPSSTPRRSAEPAPPLRSGPLHENPPSRGSTSSGGRSAGSGAGGSW